MLYIELNTISHVLSFVNSWKKSFYKRMKMNQQIDYSWAIVRTTYTLPNTETKNCTNCSVIFLMKSGDNKQCSESKVLILGKQTQLNLQIYLEIFWQYPSTSRSAMRKMADLLIIIHGFVKLTTHIEYRTSFGESQFEEIKSKRFMGDVTVNSS